jgi:hypothetical protein
MDTPPIKKPFVIKFNNPFVKNPQKIEKLNNENETCANTLKI